MIASIPGFVKWIYKNRAWEGPAEKRSIYLTFDDGPIPRVTPWVLEQLARYDARATFFCIGDNVQKHPEIFRGIVKKGHSIGNHTHNHLNGWKTSAPEYLLNILEAQQIIEQNLPQKTAVKNPIFRPPYGRMTNRQSKQLQQRGFKIVMWSILSMDYDCRLSTEKCYRNVVSHARPGSIIVFHDSLKAEKNMTAVLPKVLEHFSREGYCFSTL